MEAYCKQEGIGKQSFYQWRRRLQNGKQAVAAPPTPPTVRFAEIKTNPPNLATAAIKSGITDTTIRVQLASGHEVEVEINAAADPAATIREILETLLQPDARPAERRRGGRL